MRKNGKHLDPYRKIHPGLGYSPLGEMYGYFRVKINDITLAVISSGVADERDPWEHVSVSIYRGRPGVLPDWSQMCAVKDLFWEPQETVIQFHPAKSEYVDIHDVLHLWKPPYDLALPPRQFV